LFSEIVPEIQNTSKLIQEITSGSIEQSHGVNQVNTAIQQLNQISQLNASSSDQLASSGEELTLQLEKLQKIIQYFKLDS